MKAIYTIGIFGKEFDTLAEAKEALKEADEIYLKGHGHREGDGTGYIHAYCPETGKKAHIYANGSAAIYDAYGEKKVARYSEKRFLETAKPAEAEAAEKPAESEA